jgi:hypothetical protein
MPKLTKRLIEAAEIQAAEYFIWDDDLPGFGLRVLPSGRKGYVVQYRAGRRSRRMSLGPNTVLTCEQARTRAIGIIAATRNGDNPAAARDADRKTITVKELAERFDKEQILVRVYGKHGQGLSLSPGAQILPAVGRHRVTDGLALLGEVGRF